jgi:uncharacterized coiled-coil protein SlyX
VPRLCDFGRSFVDFLDTKLLSTSFFHQRITGRHRRPTRRGDRPGAVIHHGPFHLDQWLVQVISSSTTTQYKGIDEVNNAVRDVEHITQHNAAMVEENTAEIHRLQHQVEVLNERISHFQTADIRKALPAARPPMPLVS